MFPTDSAYVFGIAEAEMIFLGILLVQRGLCVSDMEMGLQYLASWGCTYPDTRNISANLQFSTSDLKKIEDHWRTKGGARYEILTFLYSFVLT